MQDVLSVLPMSGEDRGFGARVGHLYAKCKLPVTVESGDVTADLGPVVAPLVALLAITVDHTAERLGVDRETVIFELLDIITSD